MVVSANQYFFEMSAMNSNGNFHIKVCFRFPHHFGFLQQKIFLQVEMPQCRARVGLALSFRKLLLLLQQCAIQHSFELNLKT
jgi:hypothetical protein